MICHLSLGTNGRTLLILLLFGVLFSIPLKFLLNNNYGTRSNESEKNGAGVTTEKQISFDYRGLNLCVNFEYESTLKSVFSSSYDGNCTHVRLEDKLKAGKVEPRKSKLRLMGERAGVVESKYLEESEKNVDSDHKKSLSIAGHILAVMLIGSTIAALVEVLRARFSAIKLKEQRPGGHAPGRRSSFVDLAQRRHAKKDTIQAQKSFEIQGMMHRSPLRLIAARPPPLLRRSSFPAQCFNKKDLSVLASATAAHGRLSRGPSFAVDSDEESNGLTDFRRHSRLIRRH